MDKKCCICHEVKDAAEFNKNQARCRPCDKKCKIDYRVKNIKRIKAYEVKYYQENAEAMKRSNLEYKHRTGRQRLMSEAPDCAAYLGDISEKALSKLFDNIQRMPYGFPGYDFICGRGFKIDAKGRCLVSSNGKTRWVFQVRRNTIPDYFLLLAFDNRHDLTPMHVWLVPGNKINDHISVSISNSPRILAKWSEFEKPLDKVIACCNEMRDEVIA
jgi:hypothetical protein